MTEVLFIANLIYYCDLFNKQISASRTNNIPNLTEMYLGYYPFIIYLSILSVPYCYYFLLPILKSLIKIGKILFWNRYVRLARVSIEPLRTLLKGRYRHFSFDNTGKEKSNVTYHINALCLLKFNFFRY